ncbi:MAM and LDL-receptor class A domain-containing protein 2, partial [Trichonephila clavata]
GHAQEHKEINGDWEKSILNLTGIILSESPPCLSMVEMKTISPLTILRWLMVPAPRQVIAIFEKDFCGWNDTYEGLAGWNRTQGSGNWSEEKPSVDHTTNSEYGYFIVLPFKRRGDFG